MLHEVILTRWREFGNREGVFFVSRHELRRFRGTPPVLDGRTIRKLTDFLERARIPIVGDAMMLEQKKV